MTCLHEDFIARVDVIRLQKTEDNPEIHGYTCEMKVECADCHEPMVFVGVPVGLLPNRPTMSPDGLELRTPIRPQSSDPHFGLGIPGFIARVAEGEMASDN